MKMQPPFIWMRMRFATIKLLVRRWTISFSSIQNIIQKKHNFGLSAP